MDCVFIHIGKFVLLFVNTKNQGMYKLFEEIIPVIFRKRKKRYQHLYDDIEDISQKNFLEEWNTFHMQYISQVKWICLR